MGREQPVDPSLEELPLGSRIRLVRQARGLRLSAMAQAVGYHKGHLSRVETNKTPPSDELVAQIADFLSVSVHDLRDAPVQTLTQQQQRALSRGPGLAFAAPPMQRRSVGQRIERMLTSGHLTEDERHSVETALVAMTSQLITLTRALRDESDQR